MELRFGIIGGAAIARRSVLPAIQSSPGCRIVLAASRSPERCSLIARDFGIPTTDRYETVLEDPTIDAVYIALTNARHEAWTLRALAAGKHVYCEKPTVLDRAGATRVAALARTQRLVF